MTKNLGRRKLDILITLIALAAVSFASGYALGARQAAQYVEQSVGRSLK